MGNMGLSTGLHQNRLRESFYPSGGNRDADLYTPTDELPQTMPELTGRPSREPEAFPESASSNVTFPRQRLVFSRTDPFKGQNSRSTA